MSNDQQKANFLQRLIDTKFEVRKYFEVYFQNINRTSIYISLLKEEKKKTRSKKKFF